MEVHLPPEVAAEEILARFIFSQRDIRKAEGTPKHTAFMPDPRGETSVFRVSDMTEDDRWLLGKTHVAPWRTPSLKARAELGARQVFENGLQVRPDTTHHPRHANMVGWPSTEEEQMLVAMKLERVATLSLLPN